MHRIIVDAGCWTPGVAVIRGGRAKYVHTSVAVIAPGHKQTPAFRAASRVDADLCKSVRPRDGLNREHRRGGIDDVSRTRKSDAAVAGTGENDVLPVGPNRVKSAIWRDSTGKALNGAVVIAWQATFVVDLDRFGPGLPMIGRANEEQLGVR